MSWHVDATALRDYTEGAVATTQQLSIEAHLSSCESCRALLSTFVDDERLDRAWEGIASETAAPRATRLERALTRAGMSDHVARLLAATPSLRRSWLLALAAVLAVAAGVAAGSEDGYLFFLAVAPLLPLAGIAAAFGRGVDPTYEIGLAAPLHSFGLLLIRAVAVLVTTTTLGLVAGLFVPQTWATVAWLLPSLGLATSSLVLSAFLGPVRAAATVAIGWTGVVGLVASATATPLEVRSLFGGPIQTALLCVTAGSAWFLAAQRDRFERTPR